MWAIGGVFYPLKPAGSKAAGLLHHLYKVNGIPKHAMVNIKGEALNPLFLCSHTIGQEQADLFYKALMDMANKHGTFLSPPPQPPPSFTMTTIPSDAHHESKVAKGNWDRMWSTEYEIIANSKYGRGKLFNAEGIKNAIKDLRDKWFHRGLAPSLYDLSNARLNYCKKHAQYLTPSNQIKILIAARIHLHTQLELEPERYGYIVSWKVPQPPQVDSSFQSRLVWPGATVVDGHGVVNRNPNHDSILFR